MNPVFLTLRTADKTFSRGQKDGKSVLCFLEAIKTYITERADRSLNSVVKVLLMTESPGTNYLDSEIIKGFRREIKRKMLVTFLGFSPVCGTRRLWKNKP